MIQPKIQEVFIPATVIDRLDHDYLGYAKKIVFPHDVYVFTPEEFEAFKREFGKELLISSAKEGEFRKSIRQLGDLIIDELPKKVIEVVLDEYLTK